MHLCVRHTTYYYTPLQYYMSIDYKFKDESKNVSKTKYKQTSIAETVLNEMTTQDTRDHDYNNILILLYNINLPPTIYIH